MRTALVSLIALSALATSVAAQAPTAAPPTAAPATEPPATAAAAPAATPPVTPPAPQEPAPPPPTLPTTGDGAVVLQVLQNVCVPSVKANGGLDARAKAAGMKKGKNGAWVLALGGAKDYTITVQPQGSNRNVCQSEVRYAIGAEKPIISALNVYAFLHDPEMPLQRNDYTVDATNKRITLSWEHYTDKESTGLVLVQLKNPDGTPLNARYDTATLLYSERTF